MSMVIKFLYRMLLIRGYTVKRVLNHGDGSYTVYFHIDGSTEGCMEPRCKLYPIGAKWR